MFSTKGRYALRVMIDIAEQGKNGHTPLKDIAERQQISKKYLESIVKDLVKAGLLKGSSGKGGGYELCRDPGDYTVGEILEASEGRFAAVACLATASDECPRSAFCKTLTLWTEFNEVTRNFFYSKKLSDLLN